MSKNSLGRRQDETTLKRRGGFRTKGKERGSEREHGGGEGRMRWVNGAVFVKDREKGFSVKEIS